MGFIYIYNAIQCPMEEIHGRQSALHNAAAGGILGYVGVSQNLIGIPFVGPDLFYKYPFIPRAWAGAAVYGGLGLGLAMFGGKPL